MSESLGSGVMTFGGDDSDFQKVADSVESRMRDVSKSFTSFSFSHPGFEAVTKGLDDVAKSTERASRGLLQIGRVYYANVIGEGFKRMAAAAVEFSAKVQLGEASMGQLVEKVAEAVPYVGNFITAGRSIRDLITGETAYTEAIKEQTAEQQKRIEVVNDYIAALKKMQRAREDATSKANFNAGDSPFAFLFGQTVQGGERASEDARETLKKENDKLLKDLDEQKQKIADKIRQRKEALSADLSAPVVTATGTAVPAQSRIVGNDSVLADLEKSARLIGEKSAAIRKSIDDTNAATENLIGRQVFTRVASLVGEKFAGAFDAARASVERYIQQIPQATNVTTKLMASFEAIQQARAGNIGQFQTEQSGLGIDFARGLLNPDTFKQLTDKSRFDQLARSLQSLFRQYAPIVEMVGRIVDSNLGGPVRNIFGALGQLPGMLPGRVAEPKDFHASFVGLSEMGNRIQAAAGSGPDEKLDKIADNTTMANRLAEKMIDAVKGLGNLGAVK